MRTYYNVYWYENLVTKHTKVFTEKKSALIKYEELKETFLYAGVEKVVEGTKLIRCLHSGKEHCSSDSSDW